MKSLFESAINDKAIADMPEAQLKALNAILEPGYGKHHIFTVTDGRHRVKVYKHNRTGFITCDNYPDDGDGLIYWDYYADIIAFACKYNPQLNIEGAWLEDTQGNELYEDEDEDY